MLFPLDVFALAVDSSIADIKVNAYVIYPKDFKEYKEINNWFSKYVSVNGGIKVEYLQDEKLFKEVKKALNIHSNKYAIVIGTNYFSKFNIKDTKELEKALTNYQNNKHCNLINTINNKENIKDCISKNKGIYKPKKNYLFIIISIIVICIVGWASLLYVKKKK